MGYKYKAIHSKDLREMTKMKELSASVRHLAQNELSRRSLARPRKSKPRKKKRTSNSMFGGGYW